MDEEYVVKDHFQDILLSAIYNSVEEGCTLVFKGGTAIRKAYGIDRYSEDLDFTLNEEKLSSHANEYIYTLRDKCIAALKPLYGIEMYVHRGALGQYAIDAQIADNLMRSAKIRIEIKIGKVYLPCLEKRIIAQETTYFASIMNINEIAAEKIRAVYTRRNIENIARDLFDISFLAMHGAKFDLGLANKKLNDVGHAPFSQSSFSKRLKTITSKMWQRDLEKIIKNIPERNETKKQVMDFLVKGER